jgi:hypothetical protein
MEASYMSANQWADAIARSIANKSDKIPEGFETAKQISEHIGKKSTQTKLYIKDLLMQGNAEMKKFYIKTETATIPVPHYRLIK